MATTTILNSAVYTDELARLIQASAVNSYFEFELLDPTGKSKGMLNCVKVGGSVTSNYLADIKRTCQFAVDEVGNFDLINFVTDRVKPYYNLYNPTTDSYLKFPLGVFVLSSGSRVASRKLVSREVAGYDLTQVLKRKKHLDRYVVPAGSNPVEVVRSLLDDAGLRHSITDLHNLEEGDDSDLSKEERSYDTGSEYIATINDQLSKVNYKSLSFDNNGVAVSEQYTAPADRAVEFSLRTDSTSIIAEGATLSLDLFNVYNKVLVVVSQPDRPEIIGTAVNENPASPTSTVNTGDERVYVSSDNEDVTSQLQADAKAYRILSELSQVYQTIDFNSAIIPVLGENSVVEITHDDLEVSSVFSIVSWTIPFKAGSQMSISARRVVQV